MKHFVKLLTCYLEFLVFSSGCMAITQAIKQYVLGETYNVTIFTAFILYPIIFGWTLLAASYIWKRGKI